MNVLSGVSGWQVCTGKNRSVENEVGLRVSNVSEVVWLNMTKDRARDLAEGILKELGEAESSKSSRGELKAKDQTIASLIAAADRLRANDLDGAKAENRELEEGDEDRKAEIAELTDDLNSTKAELTLTKRLLGSARMLESAAGVNRKERASLREENARLRKENEERDKVDKIEVAEWAAVKAENRRLKEDKKKLEEGISRLKADIWDLEEAGE